ncbi:hypothetical protein GCM10023185_35670 [Hymenobacter saemangeumensis]|uniref:FAS1 domain-containing protein n=1 Tax=Hymenobacter saemangeumensis TaxID=1084522 RepID=A0ABP8IQM4_9BACT
MLSLLLLSSCHKDEGVDPSIAGIAVANSDFQVLEDAAVRGGVVDILSNKNPNPASGGNYTVFAPNNAAFARLGLNNATDLTSLQIPFLRNTLFYHVTGGIMASSALTPGSTTPSALGPVRRIIRRADGSLYVNGSKIIATDIKASNGTVHAIDKVLLATGGNIVESAIALQTAQVFVKSELTFLVEAVVYANLAGTLSGPGPFTVFAPTDQAFKDLGVQLGVPMNQPRDIRQLPMSLVRDVLLNHTLSGASFSSELPESSRLPNALGANLSTGAFINGTMTVKGNGNAVPANMVIPDVQCTNGVVHVIDRVLLP